MRTTIIMAVIIFGLTATTLAQTSVTSPAQNHLVVRSEQFSELQRLIDERASRGYRLTGISYHTSVKNLSSKGRLEVDFEPADVSGKYEYRALITEFDAQALERVLSEEGAKGFRLIKQTPIPVELGLMRPLDMFIAVMEKTADPGVSYKYHVLAYRRRQYVGQHIKRAFAEGFTKACDTQFGPVTYLVMEKIQD